MTRIFSMQLCFFLLPFFLYLGIALQAFGFYLFALLIPLVFFSKHICEPFPKFFSRIACCFVLMYGLFPVVNFLVYFFPNQDIPKAIYNIQLVWPGIFKSNFPSSLFFTGLAFFTAYQISRRRQFKKTSCPPKQLDILKGFVFGLGIFSFLYLCVLLCQHYNGIDLRSLFRKKVEYFGFNEQFPNGTFRVYGFYGHPLTVASACLAYGVFSWGLFCQQFFSPFSPSRQKKRINFSLYQGSLLSTSLCSGLCVFLSGGRTAVLLCFAFYMGIMLRYAWKKNKKSTAVAFIVLSLLFLVQGQYVGVFQRVQVFTNALEHNQSFGKDNNRPYFWKTYVRMFLDKPLVGQGNYWLSEGVREEYYKKMGYGQLKERYVAHNVYLETLGSAGIFGFGLIICCIFVLHRGFSRCVFISKVDKEPYVCFCLAILANAFHGLTQNVFFDSSVIYIYLGLILTLLWNTWLISGKIIT